MTTYTESTLDPDVVEMIADDLDDRARTLQAEVDRIANNADELRAMAEDLRR